MNRFDWKKNKEVGLHLIEYSKKEEYQRSAINRFYYSCFGPLKEYYENAFRKILPSNNTHQILINELEKSQFIEEQRLGKKLRKLRNLRNQADYNSKSQKFPINKSKNIVEEIFSILESLKKHPIRLMKK